MGYVIYCLLGIYILPIIILLLAFAMSHGFSCPNVMIDFTLALSPIFQSQLRNALGTIVVPFVTALATSQRQLSLSCQDKPIESNKKFRKKNTSQDKNIDKNKSTTSRYRLFIVLVILFFLTLISYGVTQMRSSTLIQQLSETDPEKLNSIKEFLKNMTESYMKELLAYISIVLGISKSKGE